MGARTRWEFCPPMPDPEVSCTPARHCLPYPPLLRPHSQPRLNSCQLHPTWLPCALGVNPEPLSLCSQPLALLPQLHQLRSPVYTQMVALATLAWQSCSQCSVPVCSHPSPLLLRNPCHPSTPGSLVLSSPHPATISPAWSHLPFSNKTKPFCGRSRWYCAPPVRSCVLSPKGHAKDWLWEALITNPSTSSLPQAGSNKCI